MDLAVFARMDDILSLRGRVMKEQLTIQPNLMERYRQFSECLHWVLVREREREEGVDERMTMCWS